ncbi:MAG: hypothetical protein F6K22_09165, partial [Okeania sp. SIO2F4]|uniref:hypothetical protein n=1 Tax=Okeania sp. SIO2F4 TaxID=2607790 RepID=UPI00142BDED1
MAGVIAVRKKQIPNPQFLCSNKSNKNGWLAATVSIDNVELPDGEFAATLTASSPISVAAAELSKAIPSGTRADQGVRFTADGSGISDMQLTVSGPDSYSVTRDYQ